MPWQKELSGPKNVYFDTAALSRYEKMMLETSLQRRMTPPLRQHTETTDSEESDSQSQSAFDTESEARHPSPRRMDAIRR
ncbi:MAG: hypothetical protein KVP17_000755 [Porospora cf. gigantea B]|uniref:uncharacterized protein n=1 Tax=Porospora cf. gigantea B TaxID=2853592 RepID=UPI003571A844|nr:MAG: hypothetical protein KVP17_000755 [Porospora cf. gigantea B]